jgi:hypothetical protein
VCAYRSENSLLTAVAPISIHGVPVPAICADLHGDTLPTQGGARCFQYPHHFQALPTPGNGRASFANALDEVLALQFQRFILFDIGYV